MYMKFWDRDCFNENLKLILPDKLRGELSAPCCSIQAIANHTLLKKLNSCDVPRPLSSLYP